MNHLIYLFITFVLRSVLSMMPHKKMNPNRIIFTSYLGRQYSCNPKYISKYIQKNAPEYELVWAFRSPEKFRFLENSGIKVVKYNSFEFIQLCLSSKFIVTNVRALFHIPFVSGQRIINTWHGGGAYKRVGSEGINPPLSERFRQHIAHKSPITYLSSSKIFTELTIQKSFHHNGPILEIGMPRNDILIRPSSENLRDKVLSAYQIPADHKILLYAPTVRKDRQVSDYDFDSERIISALHQRFGGKWTILFRAHYYLAEQLAQKSSNYINASDYPDMQELLYTADILTTDYSSSIWDFSFTGRPCFLYATDLSEYDLTNGFYTDIFTWPFPLAQSNEELADHILNFDDPKYREAVTRHHADFGSFETGEACSKVLDYIRSLA